MRLIGERGKASIIFAENKDLHVHLSSCLRGRGHRVTTAHGGKTLAEKDAITRAVAALRTREIENLVATSVIREGIDVGEVDCVYHYTLPQTEIQRVQANGRTGRRLPGWVVFLFMDHDLEKGLYWYTFHGERRMQAAVERLDAGIRESTLSLAQPAQAADWKPRRKKRKAPGQGELAL